MAGFFPEPVPDDLQSGRWDERLAQRVWRWAKSVTEAVGRGQGEPGTPTTIEAGASADAGQSDAQADAAHVHAVLTAAPSVPVGATPDEGSSAALLRSDARLELGIVSAQGELVGHDGSTPVALPAPTFDVRRSFLSPSGALDMVTWRAPWDCTVAAVRGYVFGGTSADINARRNSTDAHLAADLTVTAGNWGGSTSIQNGEYAAGDFLEVRLKALSGSPSLVLIQVEFTRP